MNFETYRLIGLIVVIFIACALAVLTEKTEYKQISWRDKILRFFGG